MKYLLYMNYITWINLYWISTEVLWKKPIFTTIFIFLDTTSYREFYYIYSHVKIITHFDNIQSSHLGRWEGVKLDLWKDLYFELFQWGVAACFFGPEWSRMTDAELGIWNTPKSLKWSHQHHIIASSVQTPNYLSSHASPVMELRQTWEWRIASAINPASLIQLGRWGL